MTAVFSPSILMVIVAAVVAIILLRPRVMKAPMWRATVTPLASIIGSGFLVAGPILSYVAGNWAWVAMLSLCGVAYLFGSAIRFNIANIEPVSKSKQSRAVITLEKLSESALAFAYFVSVAYYLNLFASFALRADGIIDPELTRWLASAVILSLGILGATRGLHALESLEATSVGLKLALIAGLLSALAYAAVISIQLGTLDLQTKKPDLGMDKIQILLGLVILVQGFETSRYLGDTYNIATRIKTMRYAQLLSTAIYFIFILLITPFFSNTLPSAGSETEIITLLSPLGTAVGPLIIFAALASQISAAIADMNGSGGLIAGATNRGIPVKAGYLMTALVALTITWQASILEIIVYASKAFVIYYGLQSCLATYVCWQTKPKPLTRLCLFSCATLLCVAVLIFGIPVGV